MDTDIKKKLQETKEWLQKEYSGIRTGQASPSLLDAIKVDNYGSMTPINQVGSVGIEDARTLKISPWDVTSAPAIEQAIRDADLGVSVVTDSAGLRVIFPELTVERREQLLKLAKSKLEDARITIRAARDEQMKLIEKSEKDGDISEDEKFGKKQSIQEDVDESNKGLDVLFDQKELELKG
ncbi:MAG: ribosome recycling factor [Candidatus Pacebacteria bacterium]|nr:ribosome recycling factor [Candidatus Paceibacterota bacterium]